ncbi:CHAD domain-containing protein [Chitinophaga niastensis]|uniref:CHAD domain-containing protein n=1 Tax=Chitinophaga niastensis TaxID=536980 RepID=A0A2P8HKL9_CHINA|nr:CHAD domain-containing protein [Chitinophaga niastensis]PSL46765.1 CHAD domain-containing protein [Chitinophaga niastensis]
MLQTALYNYLRKECDIVLDACAQLQETPGNPAAIHVIRVGAKKIRAFFTLAKQLPDYDFNAGKYLRTLRLIQAIVGTSRDPQLQAKHLHHYEKNIAWRFSFAHLLLHNKQVTADELLQTAVKLTSVKQLGALPEKFREAIAETDSESGTDALLTYMKDQYRSTALPGSRAHHTVWHALRKQMKTLYYQLTIMEQVLPASHISKELVGPTKKAGELLGQWHDTSELLLFVKASIAQLKREKITLPVNASALVQLLQLDTKEQLAQCSVHMRQLLAVSF